MDDQSGQGGKLEEFNPYEPGEAAVDPAMPAEPTGDGALQISPTAPPRKPTVSRAMENFNIVLDRAFGPVGVGWLSVFFGYMFGFGIIGVVAALAIPGILSSGMGDGATFGMLALLAPIVAIVAIGAASLFIGLTRALRKVAFGGEHVIAGVGEAFSTAFERFWPIVGMFFAWLLILGLPLALMVVGTVQMESPILAILGGLGVAGLAVLLSPLFYVVPATDLGLGASFSKSIEIVTTHFGYLALCFLALMGAGFALGCGLGIVGLVPFLGAIVSFVAQIAINFFSWVAFVTVFATIEETAGPFDGRMQPEPGPGSGPGAEPAPASAQAPGGPTDDAADIEW